LAGKHKITGKLALANLRNVGAQRGLTLIELLVVMGILALAATIVIVNAPPARSQARTAADDFAQTLRGAIDTAIINGGSYRLEVLPATWRLAKLSDGEWTAIAELPEDEKGDILLRIEIEEAAQSNALGLYGKRPDRRDREEPVTVPLDPFGGAHPFDLYFQKNREVWRVSAAEDGTVEVAQDE
jgi:general secretion pathway protein H